jgi:hypothetical protein
MIRKVRAHCASVGNSKNYRKLYDPERRFATQSDRRFAAPRSSHSPIRFASPRISPIALVASVYAGPFGMSENRVSHATGPMLAAMISKAA